MTILQQNLSAHIVPGELGHVRSFPFLDFLGCFQLFISQWYTGLRQQGTSHLFQNVLLVSLLLASYHLSVCLNTILIQLLSESHLAALIAICTHQYQTTIVLICVLDTSLNLLSYI